MYPQNNTYPRKKVEMLFLKKCQATMKRINKKKKMIRNTANFCAPKRKKKLRTNRWDFFFFKGKKKLKLETQLFTQAGKKKSQYLFEMQRHF